MCLKTNGIKCNDLIKKHIFKTQVAMAILNSKFIIWLSVLFPTVYGSYLFDPCFVLKSFVSFLAHTGKCIRRFASIYAYCRYFIDRKWYILVFIPYRKTCHMPKGL